MQPAGPGLQRSLWERLREVKGCVQMETESEALRRHQDPRLAGASVSAVRGFEVWESRLGSFFARIQWVGLKKSDPNPNPKKSSLNGFQGIQRLVSNQFDPNPN